MRETSEPDSMECNCKTAIISIGVGFGVHFQSAQHRTSNEVIITFYIR